MNRDSRRVGQLIDSVYGKINTAVDNCGYSWPLATVIHWSVVTGHCCSCTAANRRSPVGALSSACFKVPTEMLSALSRLLPRAFNKKSQKQRQVNSEDASTLSSSASSTTKPFTCRVILLDDTELNLNVKVSCII